MTVVADHHPDRLYDLVPVVYRLRDAERGYPLRALLRVIAEQVDVIEHDIDGLYENWFIETCQDWVVPYIGALIGYQPLGSAGSAGATVRATARERLMIPRREVANTIRFRRRKGTFSVLEELAEAVTGWPSRAVEFYRLLAVTQNLAALRTNRGRTAELRDGDALEAIGTAFDELARNTDIRRTNSERGRGTPNIPGVGIFVWRLRSYTVTHAPAYAYEEQSPNSYLFDALGHDTPLFVHPAPGSSDVPLPITRRALQRREIDEVTGTTTSGVPFFYGPGKSIEIAVGPAPGTPIAADAVIAADLRDWSYVPANGHVAVDPALGRIVFPPGAIRRQPVWVSYAYGFSAELGGGEYVRALTAPPAARRYDVGAGATFSRIGDALAQWRQDAPVSAVVEIVDSGVYAEPIDIVLAAGQTLELRAAMHARPIIRLLEWQTSSSDDLLIAGAAPSWFVLDGIAVTGRGVQIAGNVSGVTIRHSTLVPGWGVSHDCEPKRPSEPGILVRDAVRCLTIQHSIVGAIQVERDAVREDPLMLHVEDSIIDATSTSRVALGAAGKPCADTVLTLRRTTVFGQLQTHALEIAEDSILMGLVRVCRRQRGCVRFSYLPPGSQTPSRYQCQPDLVEQRVRDRFDAGHLSTTERDVLLSAERLRVEPEFDSIRYGRSTYARLALSCAREITNGAQDESEMGVFHDLYQPQRAENLRRRLNEYTPAGADVGTIYAT